MTAADPNSSPTDHLVPGHPAPHASPALPASPGGTSKVSWPARLGIAVAVGFGLMLGAGAFGMFGLLMLAFSTDSATGGLSPWVEACVFLGWPASLAAVVIVPPVLIVIGVRWYRTLIVTAVMIGLCLVAFVGCFALLVIEIGKSQRPGEPMMLQLTRKTKSVDYPHRFRMQPDKAARLDLPPAQFSLSYDDHVELVRPGDVGAEAYVTLQTRGDSGEIRHSLQILPVPGLGGIHDAEKRGAAFSTIDRTIKELVARWQAESSDPELAKFDYGLWDDLPVRCALQWHPPTRAAEQPAEEPASKALYRAAFVLPPAAEQDVGLLWIMRSHQADDGTRHLADLQRQGLVQEIWDSFSWSQW